MSPVEHLGLERPPPLELGWLRGLDGRRARAHAHAMVERAREGEAAVGAGVSSPFAVLEALREEFVGFATKTLGDRAAAEDLVQASYLKAAERLDQLRDPKAARAWFYRMLRNGALDLRRRRASETRGGVAWGAEQPVSEEAVERSSRACACVGHVVAELKPAYGNALRRIEVEGASVTELAAEEGILPNNAAVRVFRARAALKERLTARCGACAEGGGCFDCSCAMPGEAEGTAPD